MLSVRFVWPGLMTPTELISGQSPWSGCGSDVMLCGWLSLLMNVTWVPRVTRTFLGLTAPFAIVIVVAATASAGGAVGLLGPVEELEPPQAAIAHEAATAKAAALTVVVM